MLPAQADPAVNAWTVSCEKLKQMLRANGSVIVHYRSTRSKQPLYGRYVSDRRHCDSRETVTFARMPAADTKSCPVKKCEQIY